MHIESVENTYSNKEQINLVIADRNKEDLMYPLTVMEILKSRKMMAA